MKFRQCHSQLFFTLASSTLVQLIWHLVQGLSDRLIFIKLTEFSLHDDFTSCSTKRRFSPLGVVFSAVHCVDKFENARFVRIELYLEFLALLSSLRSYQFEYRKIFDKNYHETLSARTQYFTRTLVTSPKFNSENHQRRKTDSTCDNFSIDTEFKLNKKLFSTCPINCLLIEKNPLHLNYSHVWAGSQNSKLKLFKNRRTFHTWIRCSHELK